MRTLVMLTVIACAALAGCGDARVAQSTPAAPATTPPEREPAMIEKITKTDAEWRKQLTPEQYRITRQKGTERPFTGKDHDYKGEGVFNCVACGLPLFDAAQKYDSGTGWPSFWTPIHRTHVREAPDNSLWAKRTEVLCARCDAHLGHVFPDGPKPTGLRYCINAAALALEK